MASTASVTLRPRATVRSFLHRALQRDLSVLEPSAVNQLPLHRRGGAHQEHAHEETVRRLRTIVRPLVMRRTKSEVAPELPAAGHRVLVFSQFVEMLQLIKTALDQDGVKYEYLDGSTKDRQERVDHFNKDETCSAFLISLKAGGTGLNLTGADTVVHFDPWWNPAVEDQATDRAHRIGQTKVVTVYRLIARGTVEEKILQLSDKKRALMENVLSSEGAGLKGLTKADIDELFSD
jgi:SNF2 family DNA or RNA helicase